MKRLVLILAVLCASVSLASSQSLVEVAKKEKERRKKVDAAGKQSFTETDLRGGPRLPATSSSSSTPRQRPRQRGGTKAARRRRAGSRRPSLEERVSGAKRRFRISKPAQESSSRRIPRRRRHGCRRTRSARRSRIADEARKKGVPRLAAMTGKCHFVTTGKAIDQAPRVTIWYRQRLHASSDHCVLTTALLAFSLLRRACLTCSPAYLKALCSIGTFGRDGLLAIGGPSTDERPGAKDRLVGSKATPAGQV
jgi:hypothetical protein